MVCTKCRNMLTKQAGRVWKGSFELDYEHHTQGSELLESVQQSCMICHRLYDEFEAKIESDKISEFNTGSRLSSTLRTIASFVGTGALRMLQYMLSALYLGTMVRSTQISEIAMLPLKITGSLSVEKVEHLYRLDMKLHREHQNKHIRIERTFFLEKSDNTASKEVFETAVEWMNRCQCAKTRTGKFYPSRLISLQNLKAVNHLDEDAESCFMKEHPDVHVVLVETRNWFNGTTPGPGFNHGNKEYVTLSHCWGGKVNEHHLLSSLNYETFKTGIRVGGLPKTFRDAICFAAKLEDVGYIWIDALCIIQGDTQDWLHQSADMNRIYSETYLNLSATASSNNEGGLFRSRNPNMLKREEISLNIHGLRGAVAQQHSAIIHPNDTENLYETIEEAERPYLRECTLVDASLWITRVNEGPVNKRGWVLQERLMSPRVLHFCRDQIAWDRGIIRGRRMKDLDLEKMSERDALDHWAEIVEAYSKTNLANPNDKLIALSGLAKMMKEKINAQYIAGLWNTHMASQLLWRVEPLFEPMHGTFSNPATAPEKYRAPSFSWAAIDAVDHGIVYADITDHGLLITIEQVHINPIDKNNPYGLIHSEQSHQAKIILRGKLRSARLFYTGKGRYAWRLTGHGELDNEAHTNVYLDCPKRDHDCIDQPNARVYVMPARRLYDDGVFSAAAHLVCLLLRYEPHRKAFSRIGLTKLTPYIDHKALETKSQDTECMILKSCPSHVDLPHQGWDSHTGHHRICVI
ncbi:hypothetical protein ACEQ8H_001588 [Pleosporales sp. CAS-2024a]